MRSWYVVKTKPKQEALGQIHLEQQGFKCFLPFARSRCRIRGKYCQKIEPLFPGYLFMNTDLAVENTLPIRSTIGINGLVRFGEVIPSLPNDFVSDLQQQVSTNDGYIDLKAPIDWKKGEVLRVMSGPMTGWHVVFYARNSNERVLVMLDLLGKKNIVEMRENIVDAF